jgi:transcriptional regulator with XRE-family HTH domain
MPPSAGSPVRRRRLAAELRRLRGERTGNEVATGLGWSPSKISRFEVGRTAPPIDEVEKLLDFYGVSKGERSQLLSLARDANQRGWWEDFADALPEELQAFIGLEAEAASVSQWQVELVPGLLQTEGYARQVHLGYQSVIPVPPGILERRVKVRMLRQEALTRDPPLQLRVVIDESVLLRRIGDSELMYAQLQRVADLANLPNVDLRVLPLGDDRAILADSFVIFGFGQAGETAMLHDVVSIDSVVKSELYVEGDTDTFLHNLIFKSLVESSLSPDASQKLIRRTAERVWT